MTDRPIIFSGPMVRAMLEGRKTQTRRVLNPQPDLTDEDRVRCVEWGGAIYSGKIRIPYAPGDRLYVREAHALVGNVDPQWVIYRASGYEEECIRLKFTRPYPKEDSIRWRPSIHMPRWASRLTLTVTEVRVQRLQEISEADAVAEGVEAGETSRGLMWKAYGDDPNCWVETARTSFIHLWNSLHGPDAWDANPWVVAVSFTVEKRNIDA